MKFLIIDIETTGLSCSKDSITVIGTIIYDSETKQNCHEECYNVARAEKENNIVGILEMKSQIVKLLNDSQQIVAFNGVNFDMPFILKWLGVLDVPQSLGAAAVTIKQRPENRQKRKTMETEPEQASKNNFIENKRRHDTKDTLHNTITAVNNEERGVDQKEVATCQLLLDPNPPGSNRTTTTAVFPSLSVTGDAENTACCVQYGWPKKYLDFCLLSLTYTNRYISLHNVCLYNKIEAEKSGSGLQAIAWAEKEEWKLLEDYCMQDVFVLLELTKKTLLHGIAFPCQGYSSSPEKIRVVFDADMKHSVARTPNSAKNKASSLFKACW